MSGSKDHFWCHVLGRATVGMCSRFTAFEKLTQAKVNDFEISFVVNQNVLGFKVSVDDSFLMKVFNCVKNLDEIESSLFFIHKFDLFQ